MKQSQVKAFHVTKIVLTEYTIELINLKCMKAKFDADELIAKYSQSADKNEQAMHLNVSILSRRKNSRVFKKCLRSFKCFIFYPNPHLSEGKKSGSCLER